MINYVYQLVSPKVFSVSYTDVPVQGQVIVRPRYMAICHADQRYYLGQRDIAVLHKKLPMALIHECCGEVVADQSGTFAPGQKVICIPNVPAAGDSEIYENYRSGSSFLSSGSDGFMRELINLPPDRLVAYDAIDGPVAAIGEFVSVTAHAVSRFARFAHPVRKTIGVWGDGSLSFVMCCMLKKHFPDSSIYVIGKDPRKLSHFSFVERTFIGGEEDAALQVDHAFECVGGEGSGFAIDEIIRTIRPQGTVVMMGVSENKVPVYTRDILEKGLTFIGCSRSGRVDFEEAVRMMEDPTFMRRLRVIIYEDQPVKTLDDVARVFATDLNTPFKTVFRWCV